MEEKKRVMKTVDDSRTEQVHLIMHQHLNAGGRLFGGMLMQWVDEVSGVVAMRHCGTYRVTTAAVDNLQFKEPVYEGEILVMIGYVTYVGNTSMEVEIDSYVERSDGMRYMVNRAFSVMVAVNEKERPTPIPGLLIRTEAEKGRHEAALLRREMRKGTMAEEILLLVPFYFPGFQRAVFSCTSIDNFSHKQTFRSPAKNPIMRIKIGDNRRISYAVWTF